MNKTNTKLTLSLAALFSLALSACIKSEAPNAEADILEVSLGDTPVLRDPLISNTDITIFANTADSILAPVFKLSEGAVIEPESGSSLQFFTRVKQVEYNESTFSNDTTYTDVSTPRTYTVTSEDGHWKKTYTVNIVNDATPADFHFDNVRYYNYGGVDYFQIFYDTIGGNYIDWGSGNAGAMITLMSSGPSFSDYPTSQAENGYQGKCAKLTTISTGALGRLFGAPIAAGNLFLGTFSVNMMDMPASTHFGIPLRNTVPVSMSGYYKYKAGSVFTDKNMAVLDRKDDFAIYAVIFETDDDVKYLDGKNSLSSPNIVLKAEVTDHKEGEEWVYFDVPFEPQNNKSIDEQKLADGKYSIAIIMSSSEGGALFEGAVGSTLLVDEIHLKYE